MGDRTTRIWWPLLRKCAVSTVGILVASIGLAVVTDSIQRRRKRGRGGEGKSAIYSGRVWHARFKPTAHHFSYPIFFCLLDLDELDSAFPWYMWPLASSRFPALAQFRRSDHLKGDTAFLEDTKSKGDKAHAERIRDVVEEATGTRPTGRVQLLTHLAYMGYCFNPVSFYYCLDASEEKIETVIGEVSNTPWGEMHCYVLNSGAQGVELVSEDKQGTVRYRFDKDFHVSPFMSMEHTYDWRFTPPKVGNGSGLTVQTTLLEAKSGKIFFDAKVVLKRQDFSAARLCWFMGTYPVYTVWVQAAIHFEAFRLWWKKVPYFPHPEGTETFASQLVGTIMRPLFDAQEAWESLQKKRSGDD